MMNDWEGKKSNCHSTCFWREELCQTRSVMYDWELVNPFVINCYGKGERMERETPFISFDLESDRQTKQTESQTKRKLFSLSLYLHFSSSRLLCIIFIILHLIFSRIPSRFLHVLPQVFFGSVLQECRCNMEGMRVSCRRANLSWNSCFSHSLTASIHWQFLFLCPDSFHWRTRRRLPPSSSCCSCQSSFSLVSQDKRSRRILFSPDFLFFFFHLLPLIPPLVVVVVVGKDTLTSIFFFPPSPTSLSSCSSSWWSLLIFPQDCHEIFISVSFFFSFPFSRQLQLWDKSEATVGQKKTSHSTSFFSLILSVILFYCLLFLRVTHQNTSRNEAQEKRILSLQPDIIMRLKHFDKWT